MKYFNFVSPLVLGTIWVLLFSSQAIAGDTLRVLAHDKTHLNWYGNFDRWTVFPPATQKYERIWLHLTYGCPGTNCSEWDYTTKVFYRQHTGQYDSTLQQAPWFRVNNQAPDSLRYKTDTTRVYFYNSLTQTTDSTASTALTVYLFQDSLNPLIVTDTLYVFPTDYYNYLYDPSGNITDSIWVSPDTSIYQGYWPYYFVFEIIHNIEIARAITPYGSLLANTWEFTWKTDVTDYAPLFRDSAEFRILYEGWQDGFTMSLEFVMVQGTPPREAIAVEPLWTGGFPYGISSNPIENHLNLRTVQIPAQATGGSKLRILQTGHGFGGNQNCAEFCPKAHYIFVDNIQTHAALVWRDQCGLNPIYPQGGTWLYDRAGWCPGEIVHPFEHELSAWITPGGTHTLDMDMDPFTNVNNNNPGYNVGANLIHYASPAFSREAGVEEILSPSADMRYARFNPVCGKPRVVFRNNGTQALTQLQVEYGITGNPNISTYTWSHAPGLDFLDTIHLELPVPDYTDPTGSGLFFVCIKEVNDAGVDGYADNDTLFSQWVSPPDYEDGIILSIRANNAASQTRVFVFDENNNSVFSKTNYTANLQERDTLLLPWGCYRLEIHDTGKNGLSFFTFNSDGNGTARIQNVNTGALLELFNPNFGTSVIHSFTVNKASGVKITQEKPRILLFPNPASTEFYLHILNSAEVAGILSLTDITGRRVLQQEIQGTETSIHTGTIPSGMYQVQVNSGKNVFYSKVLIQK